MSADRGRAHVGDDVPWCARRPGRVRRRRTAYVDLVTGPMLDACAPHARFVDVFCEGGAFDADQARAILTAGRLAVSSQDPRQPAATWSGRAARSRARGGVGGPLHPPRPPTTSRHWRVEHGGHAAARCRVLDPVALSGRPRLIDAGATVALATDCNPGSSYTTSMALCVALAVREMQLTVAEAVWAATLGGARALARQDVGQLVTGARADLQVLDAPSYVHLAYRPGVPLVRQVWPGGVRQI